MKAIILAAGLALMSSAALADQPTGYDRPDTPSSVHLPVGMTQVAYTARQIRPYQVAKADPSGGTGHIPAWTHPWAGGCKSGALDKVAAFGSVPVGVGFSQALRSAGDTAPWSMAGKAVGLGMVALAASELATGSCGAMGGLAKKMARTDGIGVCRVVTNFNGGEQVHVMLGRLGHGKGECVVL